MSAGIRTIANPVSNEELTEAVAGRTVASEFLKSVAENGRLTATRSMNEDGSWNPTSYAELADQVAYVAGGLAALGVGAGDRIVVMLRNIPEFHVVDLAAVFLGATPVSIYNSSSPEQIAYLAGHCGAKLAVLEDHGFLERFMKVADDLPALTTTVLLKDPNGLAGSDVLSYDSLLAGDPIDLHAAAAKVSPDDLATVIYTSGTTGNPKGVMISHFNVCWSAESTQRALGLEELAGKKVVSYLPMAHIAERIVSHYGGLFAGYDVACCPDPSQIAAYAREVHPNLMFGVPRVWEKVYAGVSAALAADPDKQQQVNEAIEAALPIEEAMRNGTVTEEQQATYDFLDAVAFSTIRGLVGLDELELAITGAAPIRPDLINWFRAIGVPLTEIYGMSENTGGMTYSAWKPKPGTVGPAVPGAEVGIAEDGEVVCRGGLVFQGYLNDPEKTAEAIDSDGWLHSGDIGEMDDEGYITIVDRKKELIITAGGKNISPANLESALKTIPLVGQAAAIGDNRPFVSALVVLDPDVALAWAAKNGLEGKTLLELAEDPKVIAEVEGGLDAAMAGFNNAERVKKVKVLGAEWLPDSELLTPTSKLKRRGVNAQFAAEIEALYA